MNHLVDHLKYVISYILFVNLEKLQFLREPLELSIRYF